MKLHHAREESPHIKHLREKLKHHLEEQDKKVSPEALDRAKNEIFTWLSRHTAERVPVKSLEGKITFDKNAHPAPVHSHFIKQRSEELKKEISKDLKGRISQA
jgi:hypothetical protein